MKNIFHHLLAFQCMAHLLLLTKLRISDRYLMYVTFPIIAKKEHRYILFPCDSIISLHKNQRNLYDIIERVILC